jgi:hypothetical protein
VCGEGFRARVQALLGQLLAQPGCASLIWPHLEG